MIRYQMGKRYSGDIDSSRLTQVLLSNSWNRSQSIQTHGIRCITTHLCLTCNLRTIQTCWVILWTASDDFSKYVGLKLSFSNDEFFDWNHNAVRLFLKCVTEACYIRARHAVSVFVVLCNHILHYKKYIKLKTMARCSHFHVRLCARLKVIIPLNEDRQLGSSLPTFTHW